MLEDKPYITARVSTEGLEYEIHINGISILENYSGNAATVSVPVNHWLRSGENEIKIVIWYLKDDLEGRRAKSELTLEVRPADVLTDPYIPIVSIKFDGSTKKDLKTLGSTIPGKYEYKRGQFVSETGGKVSVGRIKIDSPKDDPGIELSRVLTLKLPFPEWGFLRGQDIETEGTALRPAGEAIDEIFPIYEKIQTALKRKELGSILPLFEERSRELDAAFYHKSGKTAHDIELAFMEAVNDPKRKLLALRPDNVGIALSPNRRLTRLTRGSSGGAITFNYTDGSAHENYDIILRKENDKWIITR